MLVGFIIGWALMLFWVIGNRRELENARRHPDRWNVPVQEKLVVLVDAAFVVMTVVVVVLGVKELLG